MLTLILSEGYVGNATLPGAAYRAAVILTDVDFSELTIKNSTNDGLYIRGSRNINLSHMTFLSNNVGIDFDNVTEINVSSLLAVSSTSDGVQMNDCGFGNIESFSSNSNGGHGFNLNTLETLPFNFCSATANTSDGVNATSVIKSLFSMECRANGGQGIEFVSGCNNNFIGPGLIIDNTSDGLKLTATSDRNIIGPNIFNTNGGWGVNIAAATCDKNLIHGNQFDTNTSGTITDSGTGTSSVDNVS